MPKGEKLLSPKQKGFANVGKSAFISAMLSMPFLLLIFFLKSFM
jgi:hypothetical protein